MSVWARAEESKELQIFTTISVNLKYDASRNDYVIIFATELVQLAGIVAYTPMSLLSFYSKLVTKTGLVPMHFATQANLKNIMLERQDSQLLPCSRPACYTLFSTLPTSPLMNDGLWY